MRLLCSYNSAGLSSIWPGIQAPLVAEVSVVADLGQVFESHRWPVCLAVRARAFAKAVPVAHVEQLPCHQSAGRLYVRNSNTRRRQAPSKNAPCPRLFYFTTHAPASRAFGRGFSPGLQASRIRHSLVRPGVSARDFSAPQGLQAHHSPPHATHKTQPYI
jgi:hypothetical protein